MAKYSSEKVTINHPAEAVFSRLTNIADFKTRLDSVPEEARKHLEGLKFGDDSIIINAPGVGDLEFRVIEKKEPELVKLGASNSPVPFDITIHLTPETASSTLAQAEINLELPAILKAMVGGKLQEAANQFGNMLPKMFA